MLGTHQHSELALFNLHRLRPGTPSATWMEDLVREIEIRLIEGELLENWRQAVTERAQAVPRDPAAFVKWFSELSENGAGQQDPILPWLAHKADLGAMRWFIRQEVATEAGFDDLLALTQIKLPERPKLELARLYWEDMGRGKNAGIQGKMLSQLAQELSVREWPEPIVTEALALGNLQIGLALNRTYAYQALGAIGVSRLCAPVRARHVHQGLKRLGITPEGQRYYASQASLSSKASDAWIQEIFVSLLEHNPELAIPLAEGALMRLEAGARCLERYRQVLWNPSRTTFAPLAGQMRGTGDRCPSPRPAPPARVHAIHPR